MRSLLLAFSHNIAGFSLRGFFSHCEEETCLSVMGCFDNMFSLSWFFFFFDTFVPFHFHYFFNLESLNYRSWTLCYDIFHLFFFFFFEVVPFFSGPGWPETHCVSQAGLGLPAIVLSLPLEY